MPIKQPVLSENTKQILQRVSIFVLCVLIIVYVLYQFMRQYTSGVSTEPVVMATISDPVTAEGYIFRNEQLIYAPNQSVNYLVSNEDRVGVGIPLADLYNTPANPAVQSELDNIERQLSILQQSNIDTSYVTESTGEIDGSIQGDYMAILNGLAARDLDDLQQNRDSMLVDMNKRQLLTNTSQPYTAQIAQLQQEQAQIWGDLRSPSSGYTGTVTSPCSGYFSRQVDGLESVFSYAAVANLTQDSFEQMVAQMQSASPPPGTQVVGKMISDYYWYMACECPILDEQYFTAGNSYTVTFQYNINSPVNCTLSNVVEAYGSDKVLLVFVTMDKPTSFDFTREQSVTVATNTYTGMQVPKDAVRIVDGVTGVYTMQGNIVQFRRVNIITGRDDFYLCDPTPPQLDASDPAAQYPYLQLYDTVIVSGTGLYDGKVLQ